MNLINNKRNARPRCIDKSALVGPFEYREAYREEYGVVGHSRHMSKRLHDEDHKRLGRAADHGKLPHDGHNIDHELPHAELPA